MVNEFSCRDPCLPNTRIFAQFRMSLSNSAPEKTPGGKFLRIRSHRFFLQNCEYLNFPLDYGVRGGHILKPKIRATSMQRRSGPFWEFLSDNGDSKTHANAPLGPNIYIFVIPRRRKFSWFFNLDPCQSRHFVVGPQFYRLRYRKSVKAN